MIKSSCRTPKCKPGIVRNSNIPMEKLCYSVANGNDIQKRRENINQSGTMRED